MESGSILRKKSSLKRNVFVTLDEVDSYALAVVGMNERVVVRRDARKSFMVDETRGHGPRTIGNDGG